MLDWLWQILDAQKLQALMVAYGLWIMAPIIFAETGLLVGFFLPGDSLLFLAGAVCALSQGQLSPITVSAVLVIAAVLGNSLNYALGRWLGAWVWSRPDGRLLKRKYLEDAKAFYDRHGAVALVLTRYIPILRTFVPFVAGTARMPFARFTLWNVLGALLWVPVLVALGWWLGEQPFVKKHIEAILLGVIAVSFLPVAIMAGVKWWRGRRAGT
jgi:membrane-associated protein